MQLTFVLFDANVLSNLVKRGAITSGAAAAMHNKIQRVGSVIIYNKVEEGNNISNFEPY